MLPRHRLLLALAAIPTACFNEAPFYPGGTGGAPESSLGDTGQALASDTSASTGPDGENDGAGGTDEATTTSNHDAGDPTDDPATSSGPAPSAQCPDGDLDKDEECDDGNALPGDGCSPTCQIETTGCAASAQAVADDPVRGMAVCRDATDSTCEEDFASLCAPGWHLCSAREHMAKNDGWAVDLGGHRALGVIRCRAAGGAGHYTVATSDADASDNCQIGSSRPECPSAFGCTETFDYALCCARITTCGDGVVDEPLEECDDGNLVPGDACSSDCATRTGTGQFC